MANRVSKFLDEHFTPLKNFRHSAHVAVLPYTDRASRRIDLVKAGNTIRLHETIFAGKTHIWQHLKDSLAAYKAEHVADLAAEKTVYDARKAKELRIRNAVDEKSDEAADIRIKAHRGEILTKDEQEFLKALKINSDEAIKKAARDLRNRLRQELEDEKAAHKLTDAREKDKRKAMGQIHNNRVKALKAQRKAAKVTVRRAIEGLRQKAKSGQLIDPAEHAFIIKMDKVGERRMVRELKNDARQSIQEEDRQYISAQATLGSPIQRLFTRLHLVSNEATVSVGNIGRNAAELYVYGTERAGTGIQLGFDVAVDYVQGAAVGTYEGGKAALQGAIAQPVRAAILRLFH